MATTSIWRVKGWIGKVVVYVENPDKTENPNFFEKKDMTDSEIQGLSDVIDYAVNDEKTNNKDSILDDEAEPIMKRFVSGVNCPPEIARNEMVKVKKQFGKEGGVVAYHGYQSFAPYDNVTPEMAHEIGMKLATQLWGEKYQVVVATHLDKSHHLHNHFVLNTVSFVDGIRYHRTAKDYHDMQVESDKLCREYGLSVIPNPQYGRSKHYTEWWAEKNGKPTYRSAMKDDVDKAIRQSMTMTQFWDNIRKMGYYVKEGKDITLRPAGYKYGLKLYRNFGEEYSLDGIRKRILAQKKPERIIIPPDPPPRKFRVIGTIHTAPRMTGLRALYFYYRYRMGMVPKRQKREPSPKQVYFLFREDIRFIQNIAKETRLLVENKIDTVEQLTAHKDGLTTKMGELINARQHLRYRSRSIKDEDELAAVKSQIFALTEQIGKLRKEVVLCDDIDKRSAVMRDKLHAAKEFEKSNGKEMKRDEPFRRRR